MFAVGFALFCISCVTCAIWPPHPRGWGRRDLITVLPASISVVLMVISATRWFWDNLP